MIRGITFSEQAFYSADFAHYQNFFLNRQCGITKGCEITQDGTSVTIGTGYFIAYGRMLNVEEPEVISAGFAEGYNRIVYEIDLSQENTVEEFKQGSVRLLDTGDLLQEDLDAEGQIYQMPFCHFQWDGEAISDFVIDAPTLVLDNIFADVSANFTAVNESFQRWLDEQMAASKAEMDADVQEVDAYAKAAKGTIDDMVGDLASGIISADTVGYDNTASELSASTVQGALDELDAVVDETKKVLNDLDAAMNDTLGDIGGILDEINGEVV